MLAIVALEERANTHLLGVRLHMTAIFLPVQDSQMRSQIHAECPDVSPVTSRIVILRGNNDICNSAPDTPFRRGQWFADFAEAMHTMAARAAVVTKH